MPTLRDAFVAAHPPYRQVYCRSTVLSISSGFTPEGDVLSDVSMPAKPLAELRTLADRLTYALDLEKKSQNEIEKQVGLGKGMLNRYASGKRGGSTVNVDKMVALATCSTYALSGCCLARDTCGAAGAVRRPLKRRWPSLGRQGRQKKCGKRRGLVTAIGRGQ